MPGDRLARQIAFLLEADKLNTVLRRTPPTDASRPENPAEHSWHLVLAALALAEHGRKAQRESPHGTEATPEK